MHEAERELFKVLDMHAQRLCELKPDLMHFGIVINGWCRVLRRNCISSLTSANELLLKMYELHNAGFTWLQSNVVVYNNVIMAYAQKGEMVDAQSLLEEMESQYYNGKKFASFCY